MNSVYIKKKHEQRLKSGHLWIFSNELREIPKFETGSIVSILGESGKDYGLGFYNPNSLISVRLLLTHDTISKDFFTQRINNALILRQRIFPENESFRLVFGESDFLPGLIIDKYDDYFALQVQSAGMEVHTEIIIEALREIFSEIKGIITKNSGRLRQLEGLAQEEKVIYGSIPKKIEIIENGLKYEINLADFQKTGYYLDQRLNRRFVSKISSGLKILDCYTNLGGFALNATMGGGKYITGVDISSAAIEAAKNNANLNGYDNIDFIESDVVEYLQQQIDEKNKWDMIILDPPAFAKSKKTVHTAIAGYGKINRLALQLINPGGFLVSSSCSHHVSEEDFYLTILKEAIKTGRRLNLIFRGNQSPDHPILAPMPETNYLKFFVFRVD